MLPEVFMGIHQRLGPWLQGRSLHKCYESSSLASSFTSISCGREMIHVLVTMNT